MKATAAPFSCAYSRRLVLLRMQYHRCHDGCSNAGLCLAFPSLNGKPGCFGVQAAMYV